MMAQRKDMMRIIRQDAGFSAKLGFGGSVGASDQAGRVIPVQSTSVDAVTEPEPFARDGGGGDVEWWQDYIRQLLEDAHLHYKHQVEEFTQ